MSDKDSTKHRNAPVKITQKGADGYQSKRKGYRVYDATVTGLFLNIGASGTKSWSLLYTSREGKRQVYRFGSLAQYDVVSARAEARKLLGQIARGDDPVLLKRKKKHDAELAKSRTLRMFLEGDYWDEHLSKRKSGQATLNRIKQTYSKFLDMDMTLITAVQLNKHRTERYNNSIKPQTLNRDRVAIHAILAKAVKAKLIKVNPADSEDHQRLDEVDAKRVRYLGMKDEHENFDLGRR